MLKHEIVAASAAASLTGLISNATGATWTLTATSAGDNLAHKITIRNDSATDHSAKTVVLTGTGPDGEAQTETVSAPAGSATVTSTKYFLTLLSAVPSATIGADTVDIGWAAASVSPAAKPKLSAVPSFNVGFGCRVVAGSPTYTVQHTYDGQAWFSHSSVASKTADADGAYTSPIAAFRLSFAAEGSVTLTGFQVEGR